MSVVVTQAARRNRVARALATKDPAPPGFYQGRWNEADQRLGGSCANCGYGERRHYVNRWRCP